MFTIYFEVIGSVRKFSCERPVESHGTHLIDQALKNAKDKKEKRETAKAHVCLGAVATGVLMGCVEKLMAGLAWGSPESVWRPN